MHRLLVELIELIVEERKKKPGGPRTDLGALRQLNPDAFKVKVKGTLNDTDDDAEEAADELGVAKRTLYQYLEDEPDLEPDRKAKPKP
jgi:hypothetical protein